MITGKSWTEVVAIEGNASSTAAKTDESWPEQVSFEGNASAVVIVAKTEEGFPGGAPSDRYEFILDCIGLDEFLTSMPILVYLHMLDGQNIPSAREYYESIFKVGSCWRISGKIGHYADCVSFDDPVYMPYSGKACQKLVSAMHNSQK